MLLCELLTRIARTAEGIVMKADCNVILSITKFTVADRNLHCLVYCDNQDFSNSCLHFFNIPILGIADKSEPGKKKVRKTTTAGGSGIDLAKIAAVQSEKIQVERAEIVEKVKQAQAEKKAAEPKPEPPPKPEEPAAPEEPQAEPVIEPVKTPAPAKPKKIVKKKVAPKPKPDVVVENVEIEVEEEEVVEQAVEITEEPVLRPEEPPSEEEEEEVKKRVRTGPLVPDTVIGKLCEYTSTLMTDELL